MEVNVVDGNSTKLTRILLLLIGGLLLVPVFLVSTVVLAMNNQLKNSKPPVASSQKAPQEYARSFHMIIREQGQNIHLWARNLDTAPDFRQVTEVNGQITSQQLYIFAEKSMYVFEPGVGQAAAWKKTGNLEPNSIGLSNIIAGPAVLALQYGVGDNQVKTQQGSVNITVKSVNQPINDSVFQTASTVDLN